MLDKRAIIRILGAIIGGGVTAGIAIKKMPHATVGQKSMGAMATIGGATVGYYVSGWVADRIIRDDVERLPKNQAAELSTGETPAETPSSTDAMGAVAERSAAVTPQVSAREVAKGPVLDIDNASNVVPIKPAAGGMDVTAFGSDPR